ncbi:MAG: hypothetical protein K9N51_01655 [Candidatus Pacebacteria bacterium]|nr:hypothetical protein [Candidatus Paceibacterota bacterium]
MTQVFIYSHTHWDREWYLSQVQFQTRLARTVDEILDTLAADNAFDTFVLDGQTSIIEDYLEMRPERRDQMERMMQEGKLAIGPWFTMPDMFLPDGEALIRNLLRGYRDCCRYGAPYPNVGYVPDSFGHIEQLPQLLNGVGIDTFVFSRGRPVSLDTQAGHKREFLWHAPDGSSVYAWHLPGSYMAGCFLPNPRDPDHLKQRISKCIESYAHSHRPDVVVVPHGVDHCWLQRDITDILDALPKLMPDKSFHHGTLEDALNAWKANPPTDLETYTGELRGHLDVHELHGTLSSRMDNKLMNERAQMHVENLAEPLDVISSWYGKPLQTAGTENAWRRILYNHAHDSICGCSVDRVHRTVNQRFQEAIELATDTADYALDYLNNQARREGIPCAIVYAGLNGKNRLIDITMHTEAVPGDRGCFKTPRGKTYPVQWQTVQHLRIQHTNGDEKLYEYRGCIYCDDLQPAEVRKLTWHPDEEAQNPAHPLDVSTRNMTNGILNVSVNQDGTLNIEDLRTGYRVDNTHFFIQETDVGGGYHFEPLPRSQRRSTRNTAIRTEWVERGPLRATLRIQTRLRVPRLYSRIDGKLKGRTSITIISKVTLEAGSDMLKVQTTLSNTAGNQRIRVVMPTGLKQPEIVADASFAVHANSADQWPADKRQNSHPMRTFVSAAQRERGLAFIGRGQHEYEVRPSDKGSELEITLLRSVDFVFQCCTWETPEAQLHGDITHDYAIKVQNGDWRKSGVPAEAMAFRSPAIANVHGEHTYAGEREAHATVGFYVSTANGKDIPVNANRSPWKVVNADRNGWRRVEEERFVSQIVPTSIVPFSIDGMHIAISAFKPATQKNASILRLFSFAEVPQTIRVHAHTPGITIQKTDLLERPLNGERGWKSSATLEVKPFEIVTLMMDHSEA